MKRGAVLLVLLLALAFLLSDALPQTSTPKVLATGEGSRQLLAVLLTDPNRGAAVLASSNSWDKDIFAAEFGGRNLLLPRPITDRLWLILGFVSVSDPDFNGGTVLRTTDGGRTWSSLAKPGQNDWWQDFAADANGRLWGLTLDVTDNFYGTAKVWYSDNNGDSWSLSHTHSVQGPFNVVRMYRIVTHPTNPYVVAIYGRYNNSQRRVIVTQNRGQSWTPYTSTDVAPEITSGHQSDLVMTASGRLVVSEWRNSPQSSVIVTSDNLGQNWALRKDFGSTTYHQALGPAGRADGSALYVVHIDTSAAPLKTEVWHSLDEGATWTAFSNLVPQFDFSRTGKGGISYDPVENAIYVANNGQLNVNQKLVMKMSPPDPNGTWQDVSYNLVPFGGFPSYGITDHGQHIATVPAPRPSWFLGGPLDNLFTAFSRDPVNLGTGNLWHQHTDLAIPGRGPGLVFTRAYNSADATNGSLGYGWMSNYGMRLTIDRSDPQSTEVTRVSEGGGRVIFSENLDGSYASPQGILETLTENMDGTFVLTRLDQTRLGFNSTGRLTSTADRNNNTTTITYDATGIDRATDAAGRVLDFTNDPQGRITQIADPLGRTVRFAYDANGDLQSVTDVKGGLSTFTYNNHQLTTITDSLNQLQVTNTYDAAGRVVEQVDALGNRTCFYYGSLPLLNSPTCPAITPAPATNETVLVNPRGYRTTYTFDASYRTTRVKDPLNGITTYTYEAPGALCSPADRGNMCSVSDSLNHTTSYTYDAAGNVLTFTNPLARTWTFTYTTRNDIATERDPLGRATEYGYDTAGNLTSISRKDEFGIPAAPATVLGRSPSGNGDLISITDGNGHQTSFNYDAQGLPDTVSDASVPPNVTNHDFDAAGRLLCLVDAEGKGTKYEYDEQNNIRFVHDAENTDFLIGSCTVAPGGADQPTEYRYDAKGSGRFVINARGRTTEFRYDQIGRLASTIDPLLRTTSLTYDPNGNLKTRTDARAPNRTVTYQYDALDQLNKIEYPDSDFDVSFEYFADGLRKLMMEGDEVSPTTYEYFADHSLKKVTDAKGRVVQYEYDDAGNRKKIVYPDATKDVDYTFDPFDRLKTVTDWLGNVTTYAYDNAGNVNTATTAIAGGPSLIADWDYDDADRLDILTNKRGSTVLSTFDYLLDKVGNRRQVVDTSGTTSYTYDDLYRLKTVAYPNADTQTYTYDAVGNRLSLVQNGNPTSYFYDDADQLLRVCPNVPTCALKTPGTLYKSEGNGTLAQFGPNTTANDLADVNAAATVANQFPLQDYDGRYLRVGHCYDQYLNGTFDGLITLFGDIFEVNNAFNAGEGDDLYSPRKDVAPPSGPNGLITLFGDSSAINSQFNQSCPDTAHFFYNGDGLRVQKWARTSPTGPMRKTDYTWDVGAALPGVLEERVSDILGNPVSTTYYAYGLDLISSVAGTTPSFYLYDGLGSTAGLADGGGTVTDTYQYDAFGALRSGTGSSAQPFRFTGEQQDVDVANKLYYLRARYYDPSLGRFWTEDPWPSSRHLTQSINRFSYVVNDPVNLTDPWGLHCRPWHAQHCSSSDIVGAVSTGVQAADLVPWGAIPLVNIPTTLISVPLDVGAFGFSVYDIIVSDCSLKEKFGLGAITGLNTTVGVGGQLTSVLASPSLIGPPIVSGLTSVVETTLYLTVREKIERCGGDQGKE